MDILALAALFAWWLWLDYRRDREDGCCRKDHDESPSA